jgi:hypothetical protein
VLQREAAAWHCVLSTLLDLACQNPERFAAMIIAASRLRDVLHQPRFFRAFISDWLRIAREHELDAQQLAKLFCDTIADLKPPAGKGKGGAHGG